MENKKDIGKLFKSKLDALEKSPNEKLWSSIHAELQEKKKKRRIVPFWFITSGIAVLFFLFFAIWQQNFDTIFQRNSIESKRNNQIKKNVSNQNGVSEKSIIENNSNIESQDTNEKKTTDKDFENKNQTGSTKYGKKHGSRVFKKGVSSQNGIANSEKKSLQPKTEKNAVMASLDQNKNSDLRVLENLTLGDLEKETITDSLKLRKKLKKEEKPNTEKKSDSVNLKYNKFYVFAHVNPTLQGYISKNSVIDDRLKENKTTSEVEYNFGGYIGFNYSDKLSFRIGVNSTALNLKTNGIQLISNNGNSQISGYFKNIDYTNSLNNEQLATLLNDSVVSLVQKVSYFEIPIEAKYSLSNKKLGVEVLFGFSTMYLNKNNIVAEANGKSVNLGSISSIKKINFSANIGMGISYKLTKNLQFNVEPIFKYHISPFENNAKIYTLNLQTGLQYIFNNK